MKKPKFKEGDKVRIVSVRDAEILEVTKYSEGYLYDISWPDAQGKENEGFFWEEDLVKATK